MKKLIVLAALAAALAVPTAQAAPAAQSRSACSNLGSINALIKANKLASSGIGLAQADLWSPARAKVVSALVVIQSAPAPCATVLRKAATAYRQGLAAYATAFTYARSGSYAAATAYTRLGIAKVNLATSYLDAYS
jgi:hypothetical protein